MIRRLVVPLGLLLTLLFTASFRSPVQGQEKGKPTVYTYVAQWEIARAQWPDAAKFFQQNNVLLDKLVADGTLTGYGTFESVIHREGEPTHGVWYQSNSVGGLLKTLETITAQPPNPAAAVLNTTKHWDEILESENYGTHSGTFKGAFLDGSSYQVKPGHGREFSALVKSTFIPILDKLLADGVIHFYSLDSQSYHSSKPGAFDLVYAPVDAAAVDKASAAFEAALGKNDTLGPAIRSMTETQEHRDFLLRVTTMRNK
jgi:hypothetical protein